MHVTVVMAVHNDAATVRAAIESIFHQTHRDWELVIVDDASTGMTSEILATFANRDRRVTVVRNPVNRGLAASLNSGWRQARGELIARMDADDTSLPDRLARQVEFMDLHAEVAVLGTAAELVDEKEKSLGIASRPERHEALAERIYKESPFIHPSVIIRRSFLEALGGYDERLRRGQDYDLWLRGYRGFRFHNLPDALLRYRVQRRPSLSAILWGTFVLGRGAYREGRLLTHGWYSMRYLTAGVMTRLGLYDARLRPTGALTVGS